MTRPAVRAAIRLAAGFGLRCTEPEVLSDGSNLVLRLAPHPVVARVATETARIRPGGAWQARDIAVARHLRAGGVTAAAPCNDPPAGPHELDGWVVSFWQYQPSTPAPVEPALFAGRLAELHEALGDFTEASAARGPYGDLLACFELVSVPDALRVEADRLWSAIRTMRRRPLHGDAHPGNVLCASSGLVWNDFEDSWGGPVGWDLACMALSSRFDGAAAVAAYPWVDGDELEVCVRFRRLYGVVWLQVLALGSARYRGVAAAELAAWVRG